METAFIIRIAGKNDIKDILSVHRKAFGNKEGLVIAKLVDDLLNDVTAKPTLSLVAEKDNQVIGHALFSRVTVMAQVKKQCPSQILSPLAILPDMQRCGIGQKLIYKGLDQLKQSGVGLVFVLGDPNYYSRCGFKTAGVLGFEAPYPIPERNSDAWMVLFLNGTLLNRISGSIRCADALNDPRHWIE